MPEGDTVYRAAARLHQALAGREVTGFASVFPALTRVHRDAPITGRTVERAWAAGKHLLIAFTGGLVLRTHMRMSGSWHLYRPGEPWRRPRVHMRIVIETAEFVAVGFTVPVAAFVAADALDRHEPIATLGPDLLATEFDLAEAVARLRARPHTAIADALLDQRAVAGIGNVFKSEVCFVARVDPFAPISRLDDHTLARIVQIARQLLKANAGPGARDGDQAPGPGSVWTYYGPRRTTGRANPRERLWVYGRGGRPCRRCGAAIHARKHGPDARLTYWCPHCQALR